MTNKKCKNQSNNPYQYIEVHPNHQNNLNHYYIIIVLKYIFVHQGNEIDPVDNV